MRTVRDNEFRAYLETFHRVYQDKLVEHIPEQYRGELLRPQHLQNSKIVGYVSTTYGVGYEYQPGTPGEMQVSHGSRRVEEFFYRHARGLIDTDGNVFVHLTGRNFRMVSCISNGRMPVRLDGPEASATLENVRWTFRGQHREIAYAELFANRDCDYWSHENAVVRAMDELLEATVFVSGMERLRLSVGDYLERFKERHVLVLGDFGEQGIKRIEKIRDVLGGLGYYAFTLQDIPEVAEYDLRQKVMVVASVCRFVVVDDSSRGGQAAELPLVELLRVPTVVMRKRGSESTFVTRALSVTSNVILEVDYDLIDIDAIVSEAAHWAESKVEDQKQSLARAYPWRSPAG